MILPFKAPDKCKVSNFLLLFIALSVFSCGDSGSPQESVDEGVTQIAELNMLNEQIGKNPHEPERYVMRAQVYLAYGNTSNAIEDILKAIQLDSLNKDYYYLLSDTYLEASNSRQSLAAMVKLASLYPEDEDVLVNLAELYLIFQMYEDSRRTVDRVLEINQYNSDAFFILGYGFLEIGDTLRAKNAYLRAAELNPDVLRNWMALGNLGITMSDKNTETYFLNALRLDSTNMDAMNSLAVHYQTTGNFEEAKKLYKKLIRRDKAYVNAVFNMGLVYYEQDSLQLAIDHFNIALSLNSALPRAYFYRGASYEKAGDYKPALNDYEQSFIFDPNNEELKTSIRRVKNLIGRQ